MSETWQTRLPIPKLRPWVSHFWWSRNNADRFHSILPDGSVDLVIEADCTTAGSWLFGTSTSAADVPLGAGMDYFGVRFRPGQARHFMKLAAKELTDHHEDAPRLLPFSIEPMLEQWSDADPFVQVESLLERHLERSSPESHRIDQVIHWIEAQNGNVRIEEVAAMYGKSRRQLERTFLHMVGISPKLFASIVRFQQATRRLTRSSTSLAEVALASGYSDQSHMTNDFRRLAGSSPAKFARQHVAFLQDVD